MSFRKNIAQKRSLYIATVRSLFENCREIWGPNVATDKFELMQKKAVKWILAEGIKSIANKNTTVSFIS